MSKETRDDLLGLTKELLGQREQMAQQAAQIHQHLTNTNETLVRLDAQLALVRRLAGDKWDEIVKAIQGETTKDAIPAE